MERVSMRDLRNHGGEVLDRVARGETLIVTRDGAEVAVLRRLARKSPTPAEVLARWRTLPAVDAEAWRRDIDELIDFTL